MGTGTVVVTGSASGMGAATAARIRRGGGRVVGVDLRDAEVVADLSSPLGRQQAVDGIAQLTDAIDGLVTFAGLPGLPERSGGAVVAVNYFGTVALLEALRPLLAKGDQPAAVAIGSNSTTCQPGIPAALVDACLDGDEPAAVALGERVGGLGAYPAAKLAVTRWVRRHAPEADWIDAGITLNVVSPGFVATPMTDAVRADPTLGPFIDQFAIPAGRPGQPGEVAAFVAFLLGPDARFFCGSTLLIDGGTEALLRPDDWPAMWNPA